MKLDNLKIEIQQEETNGYIHPSWIVYDSETGKSVKLDKSLSRYVVTLLMQVAQRITMQSDITELCQTVQFTIDSIQDK